MWKRTGEYRLVRSDPLPRVSCDTIGKPGEKRQGAAAGPDPLKRVTMNKTVVPLPCPPIRSRPSRQEMRNEFFAKLFLLGGWLGATDTYKRTMWTAVPEIALCCRVHAHVPQEAALKLERTTDSSWPGTRPYSHSGFTAR